MIVKITPNALSGTVSAPPSKSYAHRYIISAYLSGDKVKIKNAGVSADVQATVSSLNAMGGDIYFDGNDVIVNGRRSVVGKVTVDAGESGSTMRFLMPVACALGINAEFTGKGKLMSRPINELATTLKNAGVEIDGHTVKGKLKAGTFEIDASVSSQYISGLLFALPLLDGDSTIILKNNAVSVSYIDITLDVLNKFGVEVKKIENGYFVKGNQKYIAINEVAVEGDYSGAAFTLSLGALGGKVTVTGLNANSRQGDSEIISVLGNMGAKISYNNGAYTVEKGDLNAITVDAENIPDLVQVIACVSAYAKGETVIKNVDRLRIKESDRINAVIDTLTVAGVKSWYSNGNLHIVGGEVLGGNFDGGNDHRTVMSATVLGSYGKGDFTIKGAEAHQKSYPEFFNDFIKLGGVVDVEI